MEEQAKYKTEAGVQQKLAAMFAANKDEVSIPKIYIDMTGDWKAAAVLDELLFWTLPKKGTGKTSLRVFRNGGLWLAVRRADWWDRKRLTERQADTAIEKLVSLGVIEKDVFLFDGKPTVHIRMIMSEFVRLYGDKISELAGQEDDDNLIRDIADLYAMMGFPNENVNSILQNREMLNLQNGEIINNPVQPSNTTIGAEAPKLENMSIEWQIAGQAESVVLPDETHARRVDFANLVAMGTPNPPEAYMIAMAFQDRRDMTFPESKVKGQRKAIKEMLEMGVTAEHVRQAVGQLMDKGMTVADFYSVSKTAIDLANKPQDRGHYGREEQHPL